MGSGGYSGRAIGAAALEKLALSDGLTGLYNDRHLYECLAEEVGPAHCCSLPLSLLLIDFDESCVLRDRRSRLRSRPHRRGSCSERG